MDTRCSGVSLWLAGTIFVQIYNSKEEQESRQLETQETSRFAYIYVNTAVELWIFA